MLERRNSDRASLAKLWVKEANGDYFFAFQALNISEEGLFLEKKRCVSKQEAFSQLSFTLPNGKCLQNLTARMVREDSRGAAYEFMNMNEATRIELKRYLLASSLRGTA